MQLMSNGRVRRTEIEWREILTRWKKSGLSPVEFCKKEALRLTSFHRWQERLGVELAPVQFVPVTPRAEAPAVRTAGSWTLEVSLPNGVQLRFQG
jgi:hypothetical protein